MNIASWLMSDRTLHCSVLAMIPLIILKSHFQLDEQLVIMNHSRSRVRVDDDIPLVGLYTEVIHHTHCDRGISKTTAEGQIMH